MYPDYCIGWLYVTTPKVGLALVEVSVMRKDQLVVTNNTINESEIEIESIDHEAHEKVIENVKLKTKLHVQGLENNKLRQLLYEKIASKLQPMYHSQLSCCLSEPICIQTHT